MEKLCNVAAIGQRRHSHSFPLRSHEFYYLRAVPFFLLARGRFRLFRLIKFDPLKSRTINQIQYIRRTVFREFTYILDTVGRDGKLLAWISSRANFHYLRPVILETLANG